LKRCIQLKKFEGFEIKGKEDKVWKFIKTIYNLQQVFCAWYIKIDNYLQNQSLTHVVLDANIYYFNERD
jgi:hypothetical protein